MKTVTFCLSAFVNAIPAFIMISGGYAQEKIFISSPVYNVDISLNSTGTCSPWGDGASFIQYSAISQFNSIRFVASQPKEYPCWIEDYEKKSSFVFINGEGRIVSFKICPDFDPDEYPARVTRGPLPFQPVLEVLDEEKLLEYYELTGRELEVPPIVPSVWFMYNDNFGYQNTALEWETDIGHYPIESRSFIFHVPLESLGKGKSIHITVSYEDQGEIGTWDISFETK